MPTNLQNFMQKDSAELKIFQKVLGGGYFFETPCTPDLLLGQNPGVLNVRRIRISSCILLYSL